MPRRTTPFQTLVRTLQRVLQPGATVTESKFLRDRRTGEDREVDVVVETLVGPYALLISFECTSGRRPADVGWVEAMVAKHADLPTDKLVLVSQSGFTAQAETKAATCRVLTLELTQVKRHPWASTFAELRRVFLLELRASVTAYVGEAIRGRRVGRSTHLRRGDIAVPVWRVADTLLSKPAIAVAAMEYAVASPAKAAIVEFEPKPGLEAIIDTDTTVPVPQLSFIVQFHASRTEIRINVGELQGHTVLFGAGTSGTTKTHLTAILPPSASAKVALTEYRQGIGIDRDISAGWETELQPLPDDLMRSLISDTR